MAVNPWYAVQFFSDHGLAGFLTLGAVVLCVTGGEALYADMGHFGKRPIRIAWFAAVLPALILNYFGQGALMMRDPDAAANPFYLLAPSSLQWPLIGLAAAAAVVASQALISGAFSLTQQSIQLGYSPRMQVVHTSQHHAGQIYVPEVNTALMVGCLILVIGFGNSSSLSAAYGIAVTGTMAITSLLFAVVARSRWKWSLASVAALTSAFLVIDLSFLLANVVKIAHGGWVPLVMAAGIYAPRVPGTAVFMTSSVAGVPVVLLHHLKHNKALHETMILLSVRTAGIPEVAREHRLALTSLNFGFHQIVATFGFMESPNVPDVLADANALGIPTPLMSTSYFLGHEHLVLRGKARMVRWRKKLFRVMSRNARSATEFFGLPANRVVELGAQIEF